MKRASLFLIMGLLTGCGGISVHPDDNDLLIRLVWPAKTSSGAASAESVDLHLIYNRHEVSRVKLTRTTDEAYAHLVDMQVPDGVYNELDATSWSGADATGTEVGTYMVRRVHTGTEIDVDQFEVAH